MSKITIGRDLSAEIDKRVGKQLQEILGTKDRICVTAASINAVDTASEVSFYRGSPRYKYIAYYENEDVCIYPDINCPAWRDYLPLLTNCAFHQKRKDAEAKEYGKRLGSTEEKWSFAYKCDKGRKLP